MFVHLYDLEVMNLWMNLNIQGTLIRVFDVAKMKVLMEFRRGADQATVYWWVHVYWLKWKGATVLSYATVP